ncbi:unnamed protein product [Amoebophrya sp. A25]|nr:unnamed protein product [Amoebophrya sp. A25]|eukprot:GSA25T00005321001.1
MTASPLCSMKPKGNILETPTRSTEARSTPSSVASSGRGATCFSFVGLELDRSPQAQSRRSYRFNTVRNGAAGQGQEERRRLLENVNGERVSKVLQEVRDDYYEDVGHADDEDEDDKCTRYNLRPWVTTTAGGGIHQAGGHHHKNGEQRGTGRRSATSDRDFHLLPAEDRGYFGSSDELSEGEDALHSGGRHDQSPESGRHYRTTKTREEGVPIKGRTTPARINNNRQSATVHKKWEDYTQQEQPRRSYRSSARRASRGSSQRSSMEATPSRTRRTNGSGGAPPGKQLYDCCIPPFPLPTSRRSPPSTSSRRDLAATAAAGGDEGESSEGDDQEDHVSCSSRGRKIRKKKGGKSILSSFSRSAKKFCGNCATTFKACFAADTPPLRKELETLCDEHLPRFQNIFDVLPLRQAVFFFALLLGVLSIDLTVDGLRLFMFLATLAVVSVGAVGAWRRSVHLLVLFLYLLPLMLGAQVFVGIVRVLSGADGLLLLIRLAVMSAWALMLLATTWNLKKAFEQGLTGDDKYSDEVASSSGADDV